MKNKKYKKPVSIDTQTVSEKIGSNDKTRDTPKKRAKKKWIQTELFTSVENIPQWFNH